MDGLELVRKAFGLRSFNSEGLRNAVKRKRCAVYDPRHSLMETHPKYSITEDGFVKITCRKEDVQHGREV